uniref:Solute carrier family 15 member 1 n=1 Tax=Salarias fasciatus TaxID=181472 RepID=A0A672IGQ2_SALFA
EKPKKKSASIFGYPISIFFIVVNEFCERFSYYGMRAVLVLYFKYFLGWDDDFATTIYHTFAALCYLTPILGAIVADSWLGKFKTIIYLSIVYAAGQVILAVSAIHDITDTDRDGTPDNMTFHISLSMVGLLLIALGTGGIKPCVAAFGGDQFQDHQEKQRGTFFSIFYLSINAGSLLSTIITPVLRAQECGIHKQRECYPLAFGVPAALMVVALIVFIVGSGMYTKTAPQGNIMVKFCRCVGFAIKNRFRHRSSAYPKREHWMDWAEEKYDKLLIAQVKMVLKVLFLYIPLPMFWALFDQQGSRWTLQATTMNGDFVMTDLSPLQTINPILILVLVPIMDSLIYPLIAKCNLNFTALKRMTVGMFLAALAFVCAGLIQLQIDETLPKFPSGAEAQVKFINMIEGEAVNPSLLPQASADYLTFAEPFNLSVGGGAPYLQDLPDASRNTIIFRKDDNLAFFCKGANSIRFLNGWTSKLNVTVGESSFGDIVANNMSVYVSVGQGEPQFKIMDASGNECVFTQSLGFGSSYTNVIPPTFAFGENCAASIRPIMDISPNSVHMALQIPQYFLMTAGEVVFSVTGLEFAYSQAPSNMKSVLQAGWLLTVAFGNIIVLIVAEAATLEEQWAEYILFASLLVVVCVIFSVMAYFYTYIDPMKIEAQFAHPDSDELKRKGSFDKNKVHDPHGKQRKDSDSSREGDRAAETKM